MTGRERKFLELYYKACETCFIADWADAAVAAKDMYNSFREPDDRVEELEIAKAAERFAVI
jgi:hypothetical protein